MSKNMVSIVLPTYNREHILGLAIESELRQTYPYFELIIVDDGSTDNTESLVMNYQNSRIRLRTNTLNHRMEIILRDAERIGMKEQFVKLLELRLR